MYVSKKRFEISLKERDPPTPLPPPPNPTTEPTHQILFQRLLYKHACTHPLFGVHARVRALSYTYQYLPPDTGTHAHIHPRTCAHAQADTQTDTQTIKQSNR